MGDSVRVISIDALREFKAAATVFGEESRLALSESFSDVQRTIWWLQNDQLAHWQRELKKRTDKLAQAKSDLYRAQLGPTDQRPSTVIERKRVAAAERALDEATEKIQRVKKWSMTLEREMLLFKGQCQQLGQAADGEVPMVIARLDRMIDSLMKYVALQAPSTDGAAQVKSGERETARHGGSSTSEAGTQEEAQR